MPPRCAETSHRAARWLTAAAALALTPKCFLCLAAYVGLGAMLGVGRRELCGASPDPTVHWTEALATAGVMLALGRGAFVLRRRAAVSRAAPARAARSASG